MPKTKVVHTRESALEELKETRKNYMAMQRREWDLHTEGVIGALKFAIKVVEAIPATPVMTKSHKCTNCGDNYWRCDCA